jgi:hypothetical protein
MYVRSQMYDSAAASQGIGPIGLRTDIAGLNAV